MVQPTGLAPGALVAAGGGVNAGALDGSAELWRLVMFLFYGFLLGVFEAVLLLVPFWGLCPQNHRSQVDESKSPQREHPMPPRMGHFVRCRL